MKLFSNLKIKTKLLVCFTIIAAFTAIVGALSISNMSQLSSRSEGMYTNNYVATVDLTSIQNNLQEIRGNLILAIYEKNPQTAQTRLDAISKALQPNEGLLKKY